MTIFLQVVIAALLTLLVVLLTLWVLVASYLVGVL
jgi:hypothetical protein